MDFNIFPTNLDGFLDLWSFLRKKEKNMTYFFFSVYKVIEWDYYKQEGDPQADGTEETAGQRKGM